MHEISVNSLKDYHKRLNPLVKIPITDEISHMVSGPDCINKLEVITFGSTGVYIEIGESDELNLHFTPEGVIEHSQFQTQEKKEERKTRFALGMELMRRHIFESGESSLANQDPLVIVCKTNEHFGNHARSVMTELGPNIFDGERVVNEFSNVKYFFAINMTNFNDQVQYLRNNVPDEHLAQYAYFRRLNQAVEMFGVSI